MICSKSRCCMIWWTCWWWHLPSLFGLDGRDLDNPDVSVQCILQMVHYSNDMSVVKGMNVEDIGSLSIKWLHWCIFLTCWNCTYAVMSKWRTSTLQLQQHLHCSLLTCIFSPLISKTFYQCFLTPHSALIFRIVTLVLSLDFSCCAHVWIKIVMKSGTKCYLWSCVAYLRPFIYLMGCTD